MNKYEFEAIALCPNGKLQDRYDCSIESASVVPVEGIVAYLKKLPKRRLFQETLADELRNRFMGRVTVTGWHYGVKITCTRQ